MPTNPQRITGTKEWSVASVNCILGCEHDCRYCYAKARALRFGQIESADQWATMRIRRDEVKKRRKWIDGRIMFPTTHDITPSVLRPCLQVIENLLIAGNDLLIVSKPHLDCIAAICDRFAMFRDSILFRFTIGASSDAFLRLWEPGAPCFRERLASLKYAFRAGYATSVSCEPLLDAENVCKLMETLAPFVTDSIWIGKMNRIAARVAGVPDAEITRIRRGQTQESIQRIYAQLCEHPLVRWKESYKEVLHIPLATTCGQDR